MLLAVASIFLIVSFFLFVIDNVGQTVKLIVYICKTASFPPLHCFYHSTIELAGKIHWTKTGTSSVLIARLEPLNGIGIQTENVGATFETIADEINGENMNEKFLETMNNKIGIKTKDVPCGTKSSRQLIADTELNDITVVTAVTKNNANGVVLDNVPPTNDDKLDHLASGIAYQDRREECSLGKTGTTTMCC